MIIDPCMSYIKIRTSVRHLQMIHFKRILHLTLIFYLVTLTYGKLKELLDFNLMYKCL